MYLPNPNSSHIKAVVKGQRYSRIAAAKWMSTFDESKLYKIGIGWNILYNHLFLTPPILIGYFKSNFKSLSHLCWELGRSTIRRLLHPVMCSNRYFWKKGHSLLRYSVDKFWSGCHQSWLFFTAPINESFIIDPEWKKFASKGS